MKLTFPPKDMKPIKLDRYEGPRRPLGNGGYREGGGRPKGAKNKTQRHIRELCKDFTEEGVERLVFIMRRSRSDHARILAVSEIFNRAWGKAPQSLKISGDVDNPLQLVHALMTPAQAAEEYAKTLENRSFAVIEDQREEADTDDEEE